MNGNIQRYIEEAGSGTVRAAFSQARGPEALLMKKASSATKKISTSSSLGIAPSDTSSSRFSHDYTMAKFRREVGS